VTDRGHPTGPDEPGPAAEPAGWDAVAAALDRMSSRIDEFHERAAHREKVIDRLHEENVGLRAGVREAILAPVVADLIRLFDGLSRQGARLLDGPDPAGRAAGQLFASYADDVALALDRCGVEIAEAKAGDVFDPGHHAAASVVDTADPAAHNTLAEVLSVGIRDRDSGRLRRPARVRVCRYRESTAGEGED
jgi:molecular chaperone GrpE (heat shock protein)